MRLGTCVVLLSGWLLLLPLVLLVIGPSRVKLHQHTPEQECCNYLIQIYAAKEQWQQLVHTNTSSEMPPRSALAPYLKGGWERMRCPAGGQYDVGASISDSVQCSIHGTAETMHRRWTQRVFIQGIASVTVPVVYIVVLVSLIISLVLTKKRGQSCK